MERERERESACERERDRERERERERERLVNILKYVTKGTRSMGPGRQKLKVKFL